MTTEDDFQAALDANPDDHVTRLVFADWLDERDDPRAEGYRALGVVAMRTSDPAGDGCLKPGFVNPDIARIWDKGKKFVLPFDWISAGENFTTEQSWTDWIVGDTRREAEDAAALAFSKLPADRRRELLAGEPANR